jgi:hypothetical protein
MRIEMVATAGFMSGFMLHLIPAVVFSNISEIECQNDVGGVGRERRDEGEQVG